MRILYLLVPVNNCYHGWVLNRICAPLPTSPSSSAAQHQDITIINLTNLWD